MQSDHRWGCDISRQLDHASNILDHLHVEHIAETECILRLVESPSEAIRLILEACGFEPVEGPIDRLELNQDELEAITDALDIAFADDMTGDMQGRHTAEAINRLRDKLNRYAEGHPKPKRSIRDELREHQLATGCTDDHMVEILCDFIQKLDNDGQLEAPWYAWLFEYVADRLDTGPMGQGG